MLEQSRQPEQPPSKTIANVGQLHSNVNSRSNFEDIIEEITPLPPLIRIPVSFYSVKTQALVDTGAAASFICLSILRKLPYNDLIEVKDYLLKPMFRTAAGDVIKVRGIYRLTIILSNNKNFSHQFFVLDHLPEGCILGIDFLRAFDFTIAVKDRRLTYKHQNGLETLAIPLQPLCNIQLQVENPFRLPDVEKSLTEKIAELIHAINKLFANTMSELGLAYAVKHKIDTGTSNPISLPLRRTPNKLKLVVRSHIEDMEKHKIIRESTSPYAAPVVMVKKKGGEMRFYVDYRKLNQVTVKDRFPLPRIDETIESLYGAKFFTTLDLFSGYWQIEIKESDKHKTAFICEYGQYEFNRMPFGLTNAPSTFQRLMNTILRPVLNLSALVYLDDIIIFSKTVEEHITHIADVFKILAVNGLKLKAKKCEFFKTKIEYLGHVVSSEGVAPDDKKVQSILRYPEPRNQKELSSFLGLAGYYRKFVRAFAEIAHPLTSLTRKDVAWVWGDGQKDAFNRIKCCLTSNPILKYPDFTRDFIVHTDASGYGIGAVLAQMQRPPHSEDPEGSDDVEVVIAYSSKHLNDRQAKWSTTEKEAYAIVHAIDVFRPYLYGRKFIVFTDHKPLEWLMSKREPSGRLERWALKIQEFDIEIGYRAGKQNQNADTLSRIPLPVVATVTFNKESNNWAKDQLVDAYCKTIFSKLTNAKDDSMINFSISDSGELLFKDKLVVPASKKEEIYEVYHDHMTAGHLGVVKTLARIQRRYYWPKMKEDVTAYVKSCMKCAQRKPYGQTKAPLQPIPAATRVWERIAMDIVGPVDTSRNGNNYILVLSDYASRFVMTIPMVDQTARTVASHLVNEVITKYGAPEQILTDQGSNFLSELVKQICELFKIKQLKTTSYHPQTDGLVERFNRTLCDMLACYVNEDPEAWDVFLPFVTFAFNTAEQASVRNNPFYLFYGREAVLPNELVENTRYRFTESDIEVYKQKWKTALKFARTNLEKAQNKQKEYYDTNSKVIEYTNGEYVLMKSPPGPGKFNFRWLGPYIIIKRLSALNYEIKLPNARESTIAHVNRLKRSPDPNSNQQLNSSQQTNVKKRGRPRKLAGHPKKARVVPELHRPMTVIPIDANVPQVIGRKRGRPRKTKPVDIVVEEIPSPPKQAATRSNQVAPQNEYQWRPQGQPYSVQGFQQGFNTVPNSLFNQYFNSRQTDQRQWTQPPHNNQFQTVQWEQTNLPNFYDPNQQATPRYNLRQNTRQVHRY
jgi:hypothetical protein